MGELLLGYQAGAARERADAAKLLAAEALRVGFADRPDALLHAAVQAREAVVRHHVALKSYCYFSFHYGCKVQKVVRLIGVF